MSDELTEKNKTLKKTLEDLLKIVNNLEDSKSIPIYENLVATTKSELEKTEHSTEKCNSCGNTLDPWEKEICGPCKISDERIPEEEE